MSGHTYIILLRVQIFFCSLTHYFAHVPPILLHLSPKKRINPAELNPLHRSACHQEGSISIRTALSAPHAQRAVPCHSNSGSTHRARPNRGNGCPTAWRGRGPADRERGRRAWKPSGVSVLGKVFQDRVPGRATIHPGREGQGTRAPPGPANASRVTAAAHCSFLCFPREYIFIQRSFLIT